MVHVLRIVALIVAGIGLSGMSTASSLGVRSAALSMAAVPILAAETPAADSSVLKPPEQQEPSCEASLDIYDEHRYRMNTVHKAFAFTTAGLVLAVDGMGLYHFLSMQQRGHEIRDSLGYTEDNVDKDVQSEMLQQVWNESESQSERVIHTALVALAMVSYTTTATIELSTLRSSTSTARMSSTKLHRALFFLHAGLMAANVALGLLESHALSDGNHAMVRGVGTVHLAVGFAVPVVMLGAGLVFKLPLEY